MNRFQRPTIFQLNIEGFTASKMNILYYLVLQFEALIIIYNYFFSKYFDLDFFCICAKLFLYSFSSSAFLSLHLYQSKIDPDDRYFLVAWVMSTSVTAFKYDRLKPNLLKRKGIYLSTYPTFQQRSSNRQTSFFKMRQCLERTRMTCYNVPFSGNIVTSQEDTLFSS